MNGRSIVRIFAACTVGIAATMAIRAPQSANAEDASQYFQIVDGKKAAYCGLFKAGWQPALKKSEIQYVSIKSEVRLIDKKIKKARDSAARDKLTKKKTSYNATFSRTRKTCAKGPDNGGGTPAPGEPTPTPAPTVTPPAIICFLPGGDVGPGCFGIPTHLTGNINRGQVYFRTNCTGCHNSRGIFPWSRVQSAFSRIPQMAPYRPTDPNLADVVAYLNRFNF